MSQLSTKHFSDWTGGRWTQSPPEEIVDFQIDTRLLQPGQAFVALKTNVRDGHDFLEDAKSKGASAALVSKKLPHVDIPQLVVANTEKALHDLALQTRMEFAGMVVGITGSCGKTSTKELLSVLLGEGTLKTQGNLNNHLGVPLTLLRLRKEHTFAAVEIGMSTPGEIASLARITQPIYSIITSVAPVHLQGVGSLEGVAKEKATLVEATSKLTILPVECFRYDPFIRLKAPCLIAGKPEPGRYYPDSCRFVDFSLDQKPDKTDIILRPGAGRVLSFTSARTSNGMARNMVLSLLLGLELGLDAHELQRRLDTWKSGDMRCERATVGELDFFIDCYNANPSSMRDSLEYFRATSPDERPRYFVIGGMKELGEFTEEYHQELGRSFKLRSIDRLYLTGEEISGFLAGFRAAGRDEEHVQVFEEPDKVVKELRHFEGSVFLKGSRAYTLETIYQKLKKIYHPVETIC
ncbi:MAG: UDP-N-acetylmuramoyl-tripeptide--D-alanyl-D-alanine ligase [Verrucomicrobia bacterium]|nr:UDP-N-acetylmuramoyl-tripeptide--D-alanyl-D-alanine ligase [Verrucomicrobiota bacterium]